VICHVIGHVIRHVICHVIRTASLSTRIIVVDMVQ